MDRDGADGTEGKRRKRVREEVGGRRTERRGQRSEVRFPNLPISDFRCFPLFSVNSTSRPQAEEKLAPTKENHSFFRQKKQGALYYQWRIMTPI